MTFSIDSHNSANVSPAGSFTISLTVVNPNSLVMFYVYTSTVGSYTTVTSITGGSLSFSLRKQYQVTSGNFADTETWYAFSSSAIGATTFTVNLSGSSAATIGVICFCISGVNTGSYFDSNASLPNTGTGSSGNPSVTISTTGTNALLLGCARIVAGSGYSPGSGFTQITNVSFSITSYISVEYKIVNSSQTNVAVNYTSSSSFWMEIADALAYQNVSYSNPLIESGSASDVELGNLTIPFTEAGAALDSLSNSASLQQSYSEYGLALDTLGATAFLNSSSVEPGVASDTLSNATVFLSAISEAGSGMDALSDTVKFLSAISEAGLASDFVFSTGSFLTSLSEAGSASDQISNLVIFVDGVVEAGAALDNLVPYLFINSSIFEGASASDLFIITKYWPVFIWVDNVLIMRDNSPKYPYS